MIMMTFPALFLAVFGYSAILEYKNKKAMNDEIQLHDGPQSEAQKTRSVSLFLSWQSNIRKAPPASKH